MENNVTIRFDIYNLMAILGLLSLGYAMWSIRGFILMMIVALVISMFIEDFVLRLEKYKVPRMVSVLIFYIFSVVIFFGFILFLIPVIVTEVGSLSQYYPELAKFINISLFTDQFKQVSGVNEIIQQIKETPIEQLFKTLSAFFGGVLNLIIIFIVSFYLSIQNTGFTRILKIFVPKHHEYSVTRVWLNTEKKIGGWFRGQLIIAALLIIITYVGLSIIGLPYALLLSLVAGLFGFVPYGIFIAIIPAVAIGIVHGNWQTGLIVLVFYMLVQQVLDYGIQPFIFKRMTGIPSILVILSVIIGAKLFGIAGLIIAIPMTLFVLEVVAEIERHKEKLPEIE